MIAPSGEQYALTAAGDRVIVVEVGGGLRAWDGVLLGYEAGELCRAGRGQVLAPWPNRIAGGTYVFDGEELRLPLTEPEAGNAIHGLVRWASWSPVAREPDRVVLGHVLHPQPGYPFTLRLEVEYRLDVGGLTVRTSAENVGDRACPFGVGHHPYLVAPSGRVDDLVVDGEPILARVLDDCEHRPGGWRIAVGEVTVWADAAWPYVQLFSGDRPDVARAGLAVEPMTCPPNAFRSGEGLLRLEPGETFAGTWGIERSRRSGAAPD